MGSREVALKYAPPMLLSDFDYDLPRELIAQEPAPTREAARLLIADTERVEHATIRELGRTLRAGDLLVVNNTRVRRARLFARRATGGRVELFVLGRDTTPTRPLRAMVNPARKLKPGECLQLEMGNGALAPDWLVRAIERLPQDQRGQDSTPPPAGPCWLLEFQKVSSNAPPTDAELEALFESHGHVPLPPYIHRESDQATDAERYQTVFAAEPGAVAAPTAGLHLTQALLETLCQGGVELATVTLHVGLGTFQGVEVDNIRDHHMHREEYVLTPETVRQVEACRARGGRVVAVGTTSVRVLESAANAAGALQAGRGSTDIFITPGYTFRVVDVLLTNFHLPKSTLLMLVAAFIGHARAMEMYRIAIAERYRFFSYGDAMLLTRAQP